MAGLQLQDSIQFGQATSVLAESEVAKRHQVTAIDLIPLVQVVIEDHEFGKGDGKIIDDDVILEMVFAKLHQGFESFARRFCSP